MNLHRALILLLSYPKCISYGHTYKDALGQLPNPKNLRWENYKLDKKLVFRVYDMIIYQRLSQEICYKLMNDDKVLFERDYI